MMKARLQPVFFEEINDREKEELTQQMKCLELLYGEVAEFLPALPLCADFPDCDALLFPQMIFAAFRHDDIFRAIRLPIIVLTSKYGTVEMWDWEIITYLRDLGCDVFSPYSTDIAKTILRAFAVKHQLQNNAKFLIFQDTPGEGMQANIFKKFYWWEQQSTEKTEKVFGCKIIYRSWKDLCESARQIPDETAARTAADWNITMEGVCQQAYLKAVKIYIAVKKVIHETGAVAGVGANCLNESFSCDTTPCLAWNMLFERDNIIWACEGDTLSMLSTYILYHSLKKPVMMTNLYPFLVGMAALAHEKIDHFPQVEDSDNCALGVHCGYFGFVPRKFCSSWTLRPKVLEIVNENSTVADARLPLGNITLAKIYPDFQRLNIIPAKLEEYVCYENSDCRSGALIRYHNGHRIMESLSSHHSLIISGNVEPELLQIAKIFHMESVVLS